MDESGNIDHWDEYQEDLDETCDLDKDFKIYPKKIIFALIITFIMLTISIILSYSHVVIRENDGARILAYSGYGLALWFLSALAAGYYTARQIKKLGVTFIILSIISIISSIIGTRLAPILFDASYKSDMAFFDNLGMTQSEVAMMIITIMNIAITILIVLVGTLIGHSTCQQD